MRKYTLTVLLFAAVVGMLPNSILFPATRDIASHLHVPVSFIGWMVTTYSVAYVVSTPFLGVWSDRVGRRIVLVLGLALFTLGGIVPLLTTSTVPILCGRALMGVGSAGILPMTDSLIGDIYEAGAARRAALAAFGAALAVADALVPFLGGVLDTLYWRTLFAAYGLGLVAAVLCATISAPDRSHIQAESLTSYLYGLKVAWRIPSLIGALGGAVLFGIIYFGICSLLPLALTTGNTGLANGILFVPIGVGWVATSTWMSRRSHVQKLHVVAASAPAALFFVTLVMSVSHTMIPLLFIALCWGIGASVMCTTYTWVIGDDTPDAVRGAMNAVFNAAFVLGFSVGAPFFMALKMWLGYSLATCSAACLLLVAAGVSYVTLKQQRTPGLQNMEAAPQTSA